MGQAGYLMGHAGSLWAGGWLGGGGVPYQDPRSVETERRPEPDSIIPPARRRLCRSLQRRRQDDEGGAAEHLARGGEVEVAAAAAVRSLREARRLRGFSSGRRPRGLRSEAPSSPPSFLRLRPTGSPRGKSGQNTPSHGEVLLPLADGRH